MVASQTYFITILVKSEHFCVGIFCNIGFCKKLLQEQFSFRDYGDITEAYTDHAQKETVKEGKKGAIFHAHGHAMYTHTWKRAFMLMETNIYNTYVMFCLI